MYKGCTVRFPMYHHGLSSVWTGAPTPVSVYVAVRCAWRHHRPMGRESGVCDTTIPHFNPLVVIIDDCPRAHPSMKQSVVSNNNNHHHHHHHYHHHKQICIAPLGRNFRSAGGQAASPWSAYIVMRPVHADTAVSVHKCTHAPVAEQSFHYFYADVR